MGQILTCHQTGQTVTLMSEIATSGEGTVWATDRSGYLAKIYHKPTPERLSKLEVMVANPPAEPNAHLNHISFAWPQSLLRDRNGQCLGFLLPKIEDGRELLDVYNSRRRKQLGLGIDWHFLHVTALNIAAIVQKIHAEGYVLGDIKPQNILVNNRALPSIIDTDSFQVPSPNGKTYRCPVGSEEFTPPELLRTDLRTVDQTEVHDRFRLAVIFYFLLFGEYPFKGVWTGAGDPPEPVELIQKGYWPYATNSPVQLGPLSISMDIIHPEVRQCFRRCFNQGHIHPESRPSAADWHAALEAAIAELTSCKRQSNHAYSQHYRHCPWCDRANQLGVDVFPGRRRLLTPLVEPLQGLPHAIDNSWKQLSSQVNQTFYHQSRTIANSSNFLNRKWEQLVARAAQASQPLQHWHRAIANSSNFLKANQSSPSAQADRTPQNPTNPNKPIVQILNLSQPSFSKFRVTLILTSLGLIGLTTWHYGSIGGIGNILGLSLWLPFVLFWGVGGALSGNLTTSSRSILAIGIPALGVMDSLVNPQSFWSGGWLVFLLSLYLLSIAFNQEDSTSNDPKQPHP